MMQNLSCQIFFNRFLVLYFYGNAGGPFIASTWTTDERKTEFNQTQIFPPASVSKMDVVIAVGVDIYRFSSFVRSPFSK